MNNNTTTTITAEEKKKIEWRLERNLKLSRIPKKYFKDELITPDDVDINSFERLNNIKKDIWNFVTGGYSLYLHSANTGNGKTTWGIKLLKSWILLYSMKYSSSIPTALYFNVREYFMKKKASIGNYELEEEIKELEDNILNSTFVLFDDINSSGLSEYESSLLYNFVNYRLTNQLATIYTANYSGDSLSKTLSPALADRIESSEVNIELKGASHRKVVNMNGIRGEIEF